VSTALTEYKTLVVASVLMKLVFV